MYQNYIFDLYGTLVDIRTDESSAAFWRRAASVFASEGASYTPGELSGAYRRYTRRAMLRERLRRPLWRCHDVELLEVFARLLKDKGVAPADELTRGVARRFRKTSTEFIRLYDGALDLLQSLRGAGKNIYLLSNAQECFTLPELEELGIIGFFDGILISSAERVCKPERAFFERLIKRYGIDVSRSLMIGNDANSDMRGAAGVGIDGLYIHQDISPEVEDESHIPARWRIMDGDVYRIKELVLSHAEANDGP